MGKYEEFGIGVSDVVGKVVKMTLGKRRGFRLWTALCAMLECNCFPVAEGEALKTFKMNLIRQIFTLALLLTL